jgi:hypothetical protein
LNLNLVVLWTDQSRRPSAIDAPSHHGFGLYSHIQAEYSTVTALTYASFLAVVLNSTGPALRQAGG